MQTGELQAEIRFYATEDGPVSHVDAVRALGRVAQAVDDLLGDLGLNGSVRFRLSADATDAVSHRRHVEHEGEPTSIFERSHEEVVPPDRV